MGDKKKEAAVDNQKVKTGPFVGDEMLLQHFGWTIRHGPSMSNRSNERSEVNQFIDKTVSGATGTPN